MKLSDAIRLGAMVGPQVFYAFIRAGGTCALGGAYQVSGVLKDEWHCIDQDKADALFPLLEKQLNCPACDRQNDVCLGFVITHLNDDHRWTREQIAAFVEGVEQRSGDARASDAVGEAHESPVAVNARG